MNSQPRFQAEYFILQSKGELQNYAKVFHERVAKAFDGLETEAKQVEDEAYENHPDKFNPDCDPSVSAEWAYFKGVDYYLAVDAVRQGIVNLMVAGIFHLLEQQAQYLATQVLSNPVVKPHPDGGFKQLCSLLKSRFGVDVSSFKSSSVLNELRLVANTIKHGGGKSAEELRQLKPDLFKFPGDPFPSFAHLPIRPLVGEGLWLTNDHFTNYKAGVEQFWEELALVLLPIFCPP